VYDARVPDLTAYVLAGGKSTRMGSDKAFLEFGGKALLERALHTLRQLTPEVMIVGERTKFAQFGPVVEDVFRNRGPLAGIHAALTVSATDLNLMMAVDLPFMESRFLKYLLERAESTDALVTVPRSQGRLQPLCAIYRKSFQPVADRSLLRSENKIDVLFNEVKILVIEQEEIVRRGCSPAIFDNLNTPSEFDRAKGRRL
jgi:molybdenum cofactor guanylyltransferase